MQILPGGGLRGGFPFRIPVDAQLAAQSDVAQQGRGGGAMPDLDIADGLLASLHAVSMLPVLKHRVKDDKLRLVALPLRVRDCRPREWLCQSW